MYRLLFFSCDRFAIPVAGTANTAWDGGRSIAVTTNVAALGNRRQALSAGPHEEGNHITTCGLGNGHVFAVFVTGMYEGYSEWGYVLDGEIDFEIDSFVVAGCDFEIAVIALPAVCGCVFADAGGVGVPLDLFDG